MKFWLNHIPDDISFENSYVDRLVIEPYGIIISALFHLPSTHPLYKAPAPNEWGCFRQGRLTIADFTNLTWKATGSGSAEDADGTKSWDFDYFSADGNSWVLGGDWGEIKVTGDKLRLCIEWSDEGSERAN